MGGIKYQAAPFSGHLYRIEDREARLDFIDRHYAFGLLNPDGKINRSGKCVPGDRVMDMGDGWVLSTLSPDDLRNHIPNVDDMTVKRYRVRSAA